jgi:pimeloyl-ACP methyl ester carboxylesterase
MNQSVETRRWPRVVLIGAIAIVILLVLLVAATKAWDTMASRSVVEEYPPRGEFVDIDGVHMHVICQGEGEPTLALQPGIGGGALDWLPLMEELDDDYRVCAFDRLGQGWSDAAPTPRTFATAADEWHAAMQAMGIERPIVVGHSLGGAVAQIYAGRYDPAGIVLVDGLSADAAQPVVNRLSTYQSLDSLGRLGLLRPMGFLFADGAYPTELQQEMVALRSRSQALLSMSAEGALAAETAVQELQSAEAEMDAPLLIIAAGASGLPEEDVFLQGLQALDERYADAAYVLVPDASHYLIASHAQLVADHIVEWLSQKESD